MRVKVDPASRKDRARAKPAAIRSESEESIRKAKREELRLLAGRIDLDLDIGLARARPRKRS